jgi:hypothetical protein
LDTADKRGWEAWDLPWVKTGRTAIKRAWEALGIDFGNGIINRETLDQLKRGWEGFNLPYNQQTTSRVLVIFTTPTTIRFHFKVIR